MAIWIVETPRSEHVKAVAKLNENPSARFYLVRLEAVRIGDSKPAPKLTLIVEPTEEAASIDIIKKRTTEGLQEKRELRTRFWTGLIQKLRDRHIQLHANLKPGTDYWIGTGAGKSGLALNYVILDSDSRVELYIDAGKNKDALNEGMFKHFFKHKPEIEAAYGEGLDWQQLEGKQACRIAKCIEKGGLSDEDKWGEIQDAMIDAMTRLEKALRPYIDSLKTRNPFGE
jgi:hypothetical protein